MASKKNRCGHCGGEHHNRKSCPELRMDGVIAKSQEEGAGPLATLLREDLADAERRKYSQLSVYSKMVTDKLTAIGASPGKYRVSSHSILFTCLPPATLITA